MKVFPMTAEQQKEEVELKAVIATTVKPYQDAQNAYKKFVASVTGGDSNRFQRAQVSEDGTMLVLL